EDLPRALPDRALGEPAERLLLQHAEDVEGLGARRRQVVDPGAPEEQRLAARAVLRAPGAPHEQGHRADDDDRQELLHAGSLAAGPVEGPRHEERDLALGGRAAIEGRVEAAQHEAELAVALERGEVQVAGLEPGGQRAAGPAVVEGALDEAAADAPPP